MVLRNQLLLPSLPCALVSKQVLVQNISYQNEFGLRKDEPVGGTHFDANGFAQRLFLTQNQISIGSSLTKTVLLNLLQSLRKSNIVNVSRNSF